MTSTVNTVNLYTTLSTINENVGNTMNTAKRERQQLIIVHYCSFIVYRPKRGWIYLLNIIYHYLASQWLAKGCCTTVNHN